MIQIDDKTTVPFSDAGNAELFATQHGADLRWVPEWGTWLRYDDTRWVRTPQESLIKLAIRTARSFYAQAQTATDPEIAKMFASHAKSSESAGKLEAMIRLARGFLVEKAEDFDRDGYTLNVANGTIALRAPALRIPGIAPWPCVGFREHRREDRLAKISPVAYDPVATAPIWDAFLARVLPDPEVHAWVQRFAGYSLTANTSEHVLAFFHGRGANGKSTLVEMLLYVLGDYAKAGAPDLLLAKHGESHPTERADLQGARLVTCQETEAGRQWAEKTVKELTSEDTIKARLMRCDFFSFAPTHKLIVSANHRPKVRGQDEGIWRRIKLIPFEVTIPRNERDQALSAKLRAEASGILNWCLRGCYAWQKRGLGEPKAVREATAEYRNDQDHLGRFLEDVCEVVPGAFEATSELYRRYQSWCAVSGERGWERDNFRAGLLEREGLAAKNTKHARGVTGVRVRKATVAPGDAVTRGDAVSGLVTGDA